MPSKVALVKSEDHYSGVQNCLKNLDNDLKKRLINISKLVIKINFVDTRVELATTPFQAVKSLVDFICKFYKNKIIIAEAPSWGVKIDGFEKYGYYALAEEYPQITFLNLRDDESVIEKISDHEIPISKTMMEAQFLISITRPKTHSSAVVTLGIKNVLVGAINGGINYRYKIHRPLHKNLVELSQYVYPNLVIIDGLIGMEGRGPVVGTEKKSGWCLSSLDALAADSVGTYLMGHQIQDVGYLYLLGEASMGELYPQDDIEFIGENPETLQTPFQPHPQIKKIKKWR